MLRSRAKASPRRLLACGEDGSADERPVLAPTFKLLMCIYVCIYIYIHIQRERERERERSLSIHIYIYI